MSDATRAEQCVVALAECFRGDGEIVANPIGTIPMIAGRLARASFEPDLMVTDGEATLVAGDEAFEWPDGKVVEYYNPYRSMFDVVWSGRRHVVMGASQIDPWGNQNFAAIGAGLPAAEDAADRVPRRARQHRQPRDQLLGGGPLPQGLRRVGRRRHRASAGTGPGRPGLPRAGSSTCGGW